MPLRGRWKTRERAHRGIDHRVFNWRESPPQSSGIRNSNHRYRFHAMSAARTSRPRIDSSAIELFGLRTLPEVRPGDDLAGLISDALRRENRELRSGDVLVVAQKVVSKAERSVVRLSAVKPSELACTWALTLREDPRFIEVVLRESRRVIRMTERALIVETRHGFICANAGVDRSNVRAAGTG